MSLSYPFSVVAEQKKQRRGSWPIVCRVGR